MAVNITAVWRVRPSGSNTNGGGFDPGISGAATDYSQQNSAQASGTAGTASGTTTFSDSTANAFTAAMVGNALYLTGTGFTTGWYFVTAYTSASTVTLDRSPGTGTTGTWHLGGAWADFWTNTTNGSTNGLVAGNTVYVLASGVPNPSSYTYDYTTSGGNRYVDGTGTATTTYAVDPASPGYKAPPDTTGAMVVIKSGSGGSFIYTIGIKITGFWFVNFNNGGIIWGDGAGNNGTLTFGCVFDQFGYDNALTATGAGAFTLMGCEVFSSIVGTPGSSYAIDFNASNAGQLYNTNVHDCVTHGVRVSGAGAMVLNTIVAKCGGDGLTLSGSGCTMANNTVDGNGGHGIVLGGVTSGYVFNNISSNHTGSGKYGLTVSANSQAQNDTGKLVVDYNVFYNNTGTYNAITAGPHDTVLSVSPYVNSAVENYTLA